MATVPVRSAEITVAQGTPRELRNVIGMPCAAHSRITSLLSATPLDSISTCSRSMSGTSASTALCFSTRIRSLFFPTNTPT